MRFRLGLALIAMMIVGFASIAEAQPPGRGQGGPRGGFGGGAGGGGGMLALLRVEAVQKELDLTAEQIEQINEVLASLRGGRDGGEGRRRGEDGGQRRRRPQGNDNSSLQAPGGTTFVAFQQPDAQDDDRRARFEQFRQQAEQRQKDAQAKLEQILLPHQLQRLKEIYIQTAGVGALQDPTIAKELGVTEEQTEKMAEVRREAFGSMRELLQGGDRDAIREKMTEMREKINKDVLAVLTADQQAKFEKMKGEKFELPEGALERGRGRGGDGQGGRRAARPDSQ